MIQHSKLCSLVLSSRSALPRPRFRCVAHTRTCSVDQSQEPVAVICCGNDSSPHMVLHTSRISSGVDVSCCQHHPHRKLAIIPIIKYPACLRWQFARPLNATCIEIAWMILRSVILIHRCRNLVNLILYSIILIHRRPRQESHHGSPR